MNYNYTVEPSITEDPITGEQTVNVLQANVHTSAGREAVNRQHNQEMTDRFAYNETDESYNYLPDITDQDAAVLVNSLGGEERYNEMLLWASNNLSEEDINDYDQMMESGDLTGIADAMGNLNELYSNRGEEVDESELAAQWFFNEVMPEDRYAQVLEFVGEVLEEDQIETFNEIMTSGDREMMQKLALSVWERI